MQDYRKFKARFDREVNRPITDDDKRRFFAEKRANSLAKERREEKNTSSSKTQCITIKIDSVQIEITIK